MQTRLIHSPAASLCTVFIPYTYYSCIQNHAFSDRKVIYFMHTSKLGSRQKLVPIACWLSNPVTMAATVKRLQKKNNDIVSWNHLGAHFTNFPACMLNSWSAWLCDSEVFLTLSPSGCTWPLSVPLSGWLSGGCFGRKHFPLFLSGPIWYAALLFCDNAGLVADMKAGFV